MQRAKELGITFADATLILSMCSFLICSTARSTSAFSACGFMAFSNEVAVNVFDDDRFSKTIDQRSIALMFSIVEGSVIVTIISRTACDRVATDSHAPYKLLFQLCRDWEILRRCFSPFIAGTQAGFHPSIITITSAFLPNSEWLDKSFQDLEMLR
ncbi:hypothetical protein AUP68_10593 [Ilyonectria robusta]